MNSQKIGLSVSLAGVDTRTMLRNIFYVALLAGGLSLVPAVSQTATGTAGVYEVSFAGKKTSSGEIYNPRALTAALDDLRFGIRIAVTNLANGRTVTVRLNDDGPKKGHLLDLSRAAADFLGIIGTAQVRISLLQADEKDITVVPAATPSPPPPAPTPTPTPKIYVPAPLPDTYFQMGAFRAEANARTLARSLVLAGYQPKITHDGILFRVYLETDEAGAGDLAKKLADEGRKGFFQLFKEPGGSPLKLTTE